ncbi:glycosyltransferase family 2 protein [Cohnella sp. GCM10027633]|uniref:glycosyltransferase family 2 protein n=1 Tax=unclassified Cohnella TaxID=2636738 RepID=UPI0036441F11
MKISLVMATIRSTSEVDRFLRHLAVQTYQDYELIVVDQNEDDRLGPILKPYETQLPIVRLRSERGVSRSRNKGLGAITGDIVAFPDDDCWYDPDVLAAVVELFKARPELDVVTGRSVDLAGNDSAAKFDRTEGYVDKTNVWRRAISYTIFHRRSVADRLGGFDEEIGVGANSIYLSGEETDYVLRALPRCIVYYYPSLTVNHPNPVRAYTPQVIDRAYKYGCGFGKVVTKHGYSITFKLHHLIKPLIGAAMYGTFLRFAKSSYYWHSFRGRLRGMR